MCSLTGMDQLLLPVTACKINLGSATKHMVHMQADDTPSRIDHGGVLEIPAIPARRYLGDIILRPTCGDKVLKEIQSCRF